MCRGMGKYGTVRFALEKCNDTINFKEVKLLEQARKDRKKFVRYPEGAEIYSMGIQSFMKIAKEAHAVYKIRNIALVNTEILDTYLEAFRE